MDLLRIDDWARRHHGLITRSAPGLSTSSWYRALQSGRLIDIHPNVARLPGTACTVEQAIAAAVLWAGRGAMASHRSAARLHGIPRPDHDPVDILVPHRLHPVRHGVRVHRPTDHRQLTPQRRAGISCTNILRTVCDLGAVDRRGVAPAVGHVLSLRLADLDALEATVLAHSRQGRSGVGPLRNAVDRWSIDRKPANSVLEIVMSRLVERYDLPAVEFHPVVLGWEVDFRVIGSAVILECDGWAYHGLRREQFERDRRRDAELIAEGWLVVRFTYRALTSAPAASARRIRQAIDRWAHVRPPT
jgi:very-short-patch-repair endonuclease